MKYRYIVFITLLCLLPVFALEAGHSRMSQEASVPRELTIASQVETSTSIASPKPVSTPTLQGCPTVTYISPPPGLNITRNEYDEALAKWRSQAVQEYEIITEDLHFGSLAGTWKLMVRVTGGEPQVISFKYLDGVSASPEHMTDHDVNYLTSLTVESIFDDLDSGLRSVETNDKRACQAFYQVSFHPTLGYPTSFYYGLVNVFDASSRITVQSLRVLRRFTPGMPSTGNPGP